MAGMKTNVLPDSPASAPMPPVSATAGPRPIHRVPAIGVHRPDDGSLLAVIRSAAADPKCDVTKMQALLQMQKEIVAEQARLTYIDAKLRLTEKLPIINKDGKIEFKDKGQGKATLRFASFENINDVLKPLLEEFGFDLWFSSKPGVPGMVDVVGHLEHRDGYTRETTFPMPHDPSGGKSGAQGWASAFSFGKRVTTIGLLNLQTRALEDRDRDGAKQNLRQARGGGFVEAPADDPKINSKQLEELSGMLTWAGINDANFCTHYGILEVKDLPASIYEAAVKAIKDHHVKRAQKGSDGQGR